jgi:hypothetical protein
VAGLCLSVLNLFVDNPVNSTRLPLEGTHSNVESHNRVIVVSMQV